MRTIAATLALALVVGCAEPEPKILEGSGEACLFFISYKLKVRLDPTPSITNPAISFANYTLTVENSHDYLTAEFKVAGVLKDENDIQIELCPIVDDVASLLPGNSGEWSARCEYQVSQFDAVSYLDIYTADWLGDKSCDQFTEEAWERIRENASRNN